MSEQPIVNIVDVVPSSVVIPAHKLEEGDFVFDAFGGQHRVARVRRSARRIEFRRDDLQHFESLQIDETITVVKGGK